MPSERALGARGAQLRVDLLATKEYNAGELVLVEEACRMADRLEQFNDMITTKGLVDLMHFRRMDEGVNEEAVIKVTVDGVLAESRQLQLAFQRIIGALKIEPGAATAEKGDLSDDLASRRADRIARATGS